MRKIHKVLTTVDYSETDRVVLRSFFPESEFVWVSSKDDEGIRRELVHCDVAILKGDLDERFLGDNSLKWIHCDHAGLNASARPEIFERGILLSGSGGRSSPVMAEHCIYFMLNACYHMKQLLEAQEHGRWGIDGQEDWRGLYGRTAGIVGLGNNGKMLAHRLHAFGMNIITFDRDFAEDLGFIQKQLVSSEGDKLEVLLEASDFIILCLPLTNQTYHMFDRLAFSKMKRGAVFINIARGGLVCTDDLLWALDQGLLSCAGLDVFETEPLPSASPLWKRKDIYITPHFTPQVPHRTGRSLKIIAENVRRYQMEEPLLNQVLPEDIFSENILF